MSSTNAEEDYRAAIIDEAVRRSILKSWGGYGAIENRFRKHHPDVAKPTVEAMEKYYVLWFSKVMPKQIRTKTHNYDAWKDGKLDMPLDEVLEMTADYDDDYDYDDGDTSHLVSDGDGDDEDDEDEDEDKMDDDEDEKDDGNGEVVSSEEDQEEKVELETVIE
ncbi:hypothetical protein VE00_00847 [Pseudogymnoascus sp. WSF 3629]|nr:hypothetical protein VE00_00847 [Pseudogymnoascus sp. WSF 3629]